MADLPITRPSLLARIRDHPNVLLWTGEEILDWYMAQPGAG